MKKIFVLMFLSFMALSFTALAREKQVNEYRGVSVIDRSMMVDVYKQHTLLKKANQWLVKNYDKNSIVVENEKETITLTTTEFTVLLRFRNGEFSFLFTDTFGTKEIHEKEQQVIDYLTQYVSTCKPEDQN
jgi:hypothetical protein